MKQYFTYYEQVQMLFDMTGKEVNNENIASDIDWDEVAEAILFNENYDSYYSTLLINPKSQISVFVFTCLSNIVYEQENSSKHDYKIVKTIIELTLNRKLEKNENIVVRNSLKEMHQENYWLRCNWRFVAENDEPDFTYQLAPVHLALYNMLGDGTI